MREHNNKGAEVYRSTMPLELIGLYFIDLPSSIEISLYYKMIIAWKLIATQAHDERDGGDLFSF